MATPPPAGATRRNRLSSEAAVSARLVRSPATPMVEDPVQSPASQGAPCLVPVQVEVAGGQACRGFITRLSRTSAAVSTDPALALGVDVALRFRRPLDGSDVTVRGEVSERLDEGGLWRGRPAALIEFDLPLPGDFLGAWDDGPSGQLRRGSEARTAAMGDALRPTGLGRRRMTLSAPQQFPPADKGRGPEPEPPVPSSLGSDLPSGWIGDTSADEEYTAPPRTHLGGTDPQQPIPSPPPWLTGEESEPPVRTTGSEMLAVVAPVTGAPPRIDESDDEFFGRFGRVSDLPDYALPPGAADSASMPAAVPQRAASPAAGAPTIPVADDGYFDLKGAAARQVGGRREQEQEPPLLPSDSVEMLEPAPGYERQRFEDLLGSGTHAPLQSDPPPVRNTMSIGGGRPPWEDGSDEDDEDDDNRARLSLIPRNARISSRLPVTFWARGRSNQAHAQNFSKEGLFLAFSGPPPVRGAIVRIEFPVEGDGEVVPVRFNAEVRWHTVDRPGVELPDGFGVQILTFESPKDRLRYDELLALILALHEGQARKEQAFRWGAR